MREYIIKFDTDEPLSEIASGTTVRAVMKTVGDCDEIIRCKDCKYVRTDATMCLVCGRDGMGLRPFHVYHDDYCSYGEREEK